MNFEIREARMEDAAAIYELNYYEMGYEYPFDKTAGNGRSILRSILSRNSTVIGGNHALRRVSQ